MKFLLGALLPLLLLGESLPARDPGAGIKAETLVQSTRSWDGARLPAYPGGQPEITILKITIPPGARLPLHRHPVINAGVMLQGELHVRADSGKTLTLKKGDALVELVNQWHHGENRGRKPVEILVFYAGVKGTPVAVKKK